MGSDFSFSQELADNKITNPNKSPPADQAKYSAEDRSFPESQGFPHEHTL